MACTICHKQGEGATKLCGTCRAQLGLTPGDAVRARGPCGKCNHPVLIRALARELTVDPIVQGGMQHHVPRTTVAMGVTYDPLVQQSFWSGEPTGTEGVDEHRPLGILEMYICTRCGFTEWYCRDPEAIPIGEEYGTEQLDASGQGPYR
jgi:hypothetical protein